MEGVDLTPPSGGDVVKAVVEVDLDVNREPATFRLGLYDTPQSGQLLQAFAAGLVTGPRLQLEPGFGEVSSPIRLGGEAGGALTYIDEKSQKVTFGLKSQAAAYARLAGVRKAPEEFRPQVRMCEDSRTLRG